MRVRIVGVLESLPEPGSSALAGVLALPDGSAEEVLLPAYLARALAPRLGQTLTLHTLEYLESQGQGASFIPRLIAFSSARERAFFELFTTVKGLGNKRALRALAEPPGSVARAVAARDTKWLQRLPEIGKRLAETVVVELSGKVEAFADLMGEPAASIASAGWAARVGHGPAAEDAVITLVALGQSRDEAERAVERTLVRSPDLDRAELIVTAALSGS